MQYRKILILGPSGSGKSTFARRLGGVTGLPVIHLDRLFWQPGWTMPEPEAFREALADELNRPEWIIEGHYGSTLELRLVHCDLAVYLDLPRRIYFRRILTRTLKGLGRTRPDSAPGCPERLDWAFMRYTWRFEKTLGRPAKAQIHASGVPAVWLKSDRDKQRYLNHVRETKHPLSADGTLFTKEGKDGTRETM